MCHHAGIDNFILIISSMMSSARIMVADDSAEVAAEPSVRIALSIAVCVAWLQVFLNAFVPFERFGVFVLVVQKMFFGDMTTWILIVAPLFLGLTTALNAVA